MRSVLKPLGAAACCAALACAAPLAVGRLLRLAFVRAGERVAGAVVDVGNARVRLLSGRLELRSVAVADKRRPWRNLFQFDRAVLEFSPKALLRGRVLVREAGVDGLVAGGARSSSGALDDAQATPFESMLEEQLAPAGGAATRQRRALDAAAARLAALDQAEPDPAAARLTSDVRDIARAAAALRSSGLLSRARLAQRGGELAALNRRAADVRAELDEAVRELTDRLEAVQRGLDEVADARAQDADARLVGQGVPELDASGLNRRLLGASAAEAVVTGLSWVRLARETRPAAGRPVIAVDTTRLSGKIEGASGAQDMDLEGMILGASSDPQLYGKPTRLFFKGEAPGGASVLGMQGSLDQTRLPGSAEMAFHYSGIPLKGGALGDDRLGAAIKAGLGRVNGALRIEGRRWNGRFSFVAEGVRLSPRIGWAGPAAQETAAWLKSIRVFKVEVRVDGDDDDLRVTLDSSLGPALAKTLLSSAPPHWLDARAETERQADADCGGRLASLRAKAARLGAALQAPLDKDRAALSAALRRGEDQTIEASFPGD